MKKVQPNLKHIDSPEGSDDDMPDANEPARLPYSFDMTQLEAGGMVLIDACIPAVVAVKFLKMLRRSVADAPAV